MAKERLPGSKEDNFCGLVIDKQEIKLVKIAGGLKNSRVVSYNSQELPSGLISEGEVTSPNKLAEIIKRLQQNAKPHSDKSKFCVLGLPEDQIFVQTMEVPSELSQPEISRTVEHRSQELFPLPYKKIILDWQVIGEDKDKKKKQLLAIASPQRIIDSLIESVKQADLTPLAIKPKSFAIKKLLSFILKKQSLILIDFEKENASLSIYQQGKMKFHTKIGSPLTVESVAGAISRTLHYYEDKYPSARPIKRVLFSGDTGDKTFLAEIGQRFPNVQVEKITVPEIKGPKEFQERKVFLASAISLSMGRVKIFSKHGRINLLPTYLKNNYRVGVANYYLGFITRLGLIFNLLLLGLMGVFYYKLQLDFNELDQVIESKENYQVAQSLQEKEKIVGRVNKKAQRIIQFDNQDEKIPEKMEEILGFMPNGLSLTNLSYSEGSGVVSGIGARKGILSFQERLNNHPDIKEVSLPLSSLEKEQDASFQVEFKLKK